MQLRAWELNPEEYSKEAPTCQKSSTTLLLYSISLLVSSNCYTYLLISGEERLSIRGTPLELIIMVHSNMRVSFRTGDVGLILPPFALLGYYTSTWAFQSSLMWAHSREQLGAPLLGLYHAIWASSHVMGLAWAWGPLVVILLYL